MAAEKSAEVPESLNANSSNPFTYYYAQLSHQGNMLQDYVRTGVYQQAIQSNPSDFEGKVVLDVGTGTGILAFFALQAGAKKVYAVDASDSCVIAKKLADKNGFSDRLEIIQGKIEHINLPEKVDVIVSEPIGFLLVHERMLESYVVARDRFLKPEGQMYPSNGSIILAPITDDALYQEQLSKVSFWENSNFYGIDITPAIEQACIETFAQPIVGYFHTKSIISSQRTVHSIDFNLVTCEELQNFDIPFSFRIDKTAIMHGLGGWFDLDFAGTDLKSVLSTSPDSPGTHWYQCRLLLKEPIAVNKGQYVTGVLKFQSNEKFSYDISMEVNIQGTEIFSSNLIHLNDQSYHYLTSSNSAVDMYGYSHGQHNYQ